jgi:hypothetical protein
MGEILSESELCAKYSTDVRLLTALKRFVNVQEREALEGVP